MSNHKNQIDHMASLAKDSARSGTVQDKASYQLKMLGYKGSLQDQLAKYEWDYNEKNKDMRSSMHPDLPELEEQDAEFAEVKTPSVGRRVLNLFGGSTK